MLFSHTNSFTAVNMGKQSIYQTCMKCAIIRQDFWLLLVYCGFTSHSVIFQLYNVGTLLSRTPKIVAAFEKCMCCLQNIAMWVQQTDRQTDGRTTDKVIPMCGYATQATQKWTCCWAPMPWSAKVLKVCWVYSENHDARSKHLQLEKSKRQRSPSLPLAKEGDFMLNNFTTFFNSAIFKFWLKFWSWWHTPSI